MTMYDSFKKYAVQASSVEDFCNCYHQRRAYHERGEDYMQFDLASHKAELEKHGYTFIPHNDSVTGQIVAYYGEM